MSRSTKRPAREPLSRERIEDASFDLIEKEGLAGFSFRKLASALGCEAMSIYHYFPSKGHLMDSLADRVIGEIPALPPPSVPWIERLRILCQDYRAGLVKRPGMFTYMATFRMNTPICLAYLDGVIRLFCEGGLTREESVRTFRVFSYYLSGTALDETAGYARGPSTAEPIPADRFESDFPHVAAAGPFFQSSQWDRTFEAGLDLLLEGVARRVETVRGHG